jgi:NAD(P)-dependent dehydrogenase (short-subunit alcohol dehydrogenase family)
MWSTWHWISTRPSTGRSTRLTTLRRTSDPGSPMAELVSLPCPTSKTALNMVTALYAKELWGTAVKVNAANPGYCATDLNDHSGFRTATQGAETVVHLVTLGDDGPTGSFYGHIWRTDPRPGDPEVGTLPW